MSSDEAFHPELFVYVLEERRKDNNLCESSGELWGESSWCTLFCIRGIGTCESGGALPHLQRWIELDWKKDLKWGREQRVPADLLWWDRCCCYSDRRRMSFWGQSSWPRRLSAGSIPDWKEEWAGESPEDSLYGDIIFRLLFHSNCFRNFIKKEN